MASKTVDEYIDCERCPNRIFNTGKYIQGGRGSIHGDIVFLFPRGDRLLNLKMIIFIIYLNNVLLMILIGLIKIEITMN